jgi:hypothetical protein
VERCPHLLILDNGPFIDYDPDSSFRGKRRLAPLHHTRPLSPLFIQVEEAETSWFRSELSKLGRLLPGRCRFSARVKVEFHNQHVKLTSHRGYSLHRTRDHLSLCTAETLDSTCTRLRSAPSSWPCQLASCGVSFRGGHHYAAIAVTSHHFLLPSPRPLH